MDGSEGWRMMGYSTGVKDETMIDRIILRFRPIAPKPATGDLDPGAGSKDKLRLLGYRKKRKYVRVNKNSCGKNKRVSSSYHRETEKEVGDFQKGITLQLLPEKNEGTEDHKKESHQVLGCNPQLAVSAKQESTDQENHHQDPPTAPTLFNSKQDVIHGASPQDRKLVVNPTVPQKTVVVVESWVTVECVTEVLGTCMEGQIERLGRTDDERMRILEQDTCPGFVSDGSNNVQWINGAFKRMVNDREGNCKDQLEERSPEITVSLEVKVGLLAYFSLCSAFTCWVRLRDAWKKNRCLQMVPCDVWRMDFGGFAWRLDIEAALSLGR